MCPPPEKKLEVLPGVERTHILYSPSVSNKSFSFSSDKPHHLSFSPVVSFILTLCTVVITIHSFSILSHYEENGIISIVWGSAWMTCVSTGLGSLPFIFFSNIGHRNVAISNAIAAGMMISASFGLVLEGITAKSATHEWCLDSSAKTLIGIYLGVGFIKLTENFFGDFDHIEELKQIQGLGDMKRLLLIFAVMTLHSFAEGVGLGVSFHSESLGSYITTTLAIHNVPEGLALAIVLVPRGVSKLSTALLCVFSSLPQPIMAVPAYIFVDYFEMIVPLGLGFAAGAMIYVAIFELFAEAKETLKIGTALFISLLSSLFMVLLQVFVA